MKSTVHPMYKPFKATAIQLLHKLSPKHLDRYVQEFASRQNLRESDTYEQIAALSSGMEGKRLRYRELIADNGLASGARS